MGDPPEKATGESVQGSRRSRRINPTPKDRVEKALHLYFDDDRMSEQDIADKCGIHRSLLQRSEPMHAFE